MKDWIKIILITIATFFLIAAATLVFAYIYLLHPIFWGTVYLIGSMLIIAYIVKKIITKHNE